MENLVTQTNNNTLCYICKNHNIAQEDNIEFKYINCEKYGFYIFLSCGFCNKKIYFKKNEDDIPLNGMNGINIKCRYKQCGKYFFLTICPECKKYQKILKEIKEGEIIKCIYESCGCEYYQIKCPVANCRDVVYFSKPKNLSNNSNIIAFNHKKILIYQKVSCHYCIRPIVYLSEKNNINRYYDSMKIICPYQDCKKAFNRTICPICFEINIIEGGYYFMGHKIQCNRCKSYYGNILCPKCLKLNPLEQYFFKSGEIICRYAQCQKKSYVVNCLHCQRMNVFNDKVPIPGQKIECGYKDCGKIFNEVYCPSCNELNPFFKGNFSFGKSYKCLYSFCNKYIQSFICPNCFNYSRTSEFEEGKKYTCNTNNCKTLLSNWRCPFCKNTIMDKNSTLKYGQMVKCPEPSCQKKYCFCRCFECQKLIFSEENQYILGISTACKNCRNYSVNIICPYCSTKLSFLDRIDDMENGERIKCSKCEKEFEFIHKNNEIIDQSEIYSKNLFVFSEIIKGEPIKFGEGLIDENYQYLENLLIKNDSLYETEANDEKEKQNKIIKYSNLCIICHCDKKESVFYPCGHRCACYKCALYYFHLNKKCPRCNSNAENIIPKIYEQFNDTEVKEMEIESKENI